MGKAMSLQTIEEKIKSAITEGGNLKFTGALIGSESIGNLLSKYFTDGAISLSDAASVLNDAAHDITVTGTTAFGGVKSCAATITITLDESGNPVVVAVIEAGDASALPVLFPSVKDPLMSKLGIAGCRIVFTSAQKPYHDPDFDVLLAQGLNLAAHLSLAKSSPIAALEPFFGSVPVLVVSGPITDSSLPLFVLRTSPLQATLGSISIDQAGLVFSIDSAGELNDLPIPVATSGIAGRISVGGKSADLSASLADGVSLMTFQADFDGVSLAALSDLAAFTGGAGLLPALPRDIQDEIADVGSHFTLKRITFTADIGGMTLSSASVALAIDLKGYKIFDAIPTLTIDAIDLAFFVDIGSPSSVTFEATADIKAGDFALTLGFQTQPGNGYIISAQQDEGTDLKLDAVITSFLPDLTGFPDLDVTEFGVMIAPKQSQYSFQAAISSDWTILASPALTLTEIDVSANSQNGSVTGALSGTLTLAVETDGQDADNDANIDIRVDVSKEDTGWRVSGASGAGQIIPVGHLIQALVGTFDTPDSVPSVIKDMTIADLSLAFTTATGGNTDFAFACRIEDEVCGTPVQLAVTVTTAKSGQDYANSFSAKLLIGSALFSGDLKTGGHDSTLSLFWKAQGGASLGLEDIAHSFGLTLPDIPKGLDLALKGAGFHYDFTSKTLVVEAESANYGKAVFVAAKDANAQAWNFVFGLRIDDPISLSNLPLVNSVLPAKDTVAVKDITVLIASAVLDPQAAGADKEAVEKKIAAFNALIDDGYPKLPAQGMPGKVSLSAAFDFGGYVIPLSIGTGAPGKEGADTKAPTAGSGTGDGSGAIPAPVPAADGATWFSVQKHFGPVNIEKIGVAYKDGILWFLLNASLSAGGLEVSLDGLSIGSPLTSFKPEFNIEGLGIDYSNPALTIGGAFIKEQNPKPPISLEFSGGATIQLKKFGIAAVGSYAQLDGGATSMFIFASATGTFGGPGFFFVTGFGGGFGYNSALRIPTQDEVADFPLVAFLSNPGTFGPTPTPMSVLAKLMDGDKPWVSPAVGEFWIAAGITFTTYEVVKSTALLTAEFGDTFVLALMGTSSARFPLDGSTTYAYVELQLEAIFDPADGAMSFSAVLSPNSYLLDPDCHLTGGFALCFWFDPSPHAGDFVLTLGGYSPYFSPPAHYPAEPRLGFNWAVSSSVSLRGEAYFALTPGAVMAGCGLSAQYHSGNLKAWFDAHTDIIIWFNPFHFIADIGINVGASYTLDLFFCSKTFSVELGADMTLWGPSTGGTATIHWWVISFTVDFGADRSSQPDRLDWSGFQRVLPAASSAVKIVPQTGLFAMPGDGTAAPAEKAAEAAPVWVVRKDNFRFTTTSIMPLTQLRIDGGTPVKTGDAVNIKPMGKTGLTSFGDARIVSRETGRNVLDSTWTVAANTAGVPAALWGTGSNTAVPKAGESLIAGQMVGFDITVPAPVLGAGTGDINIKDDLQYTILDPGPNPLRLGLSPSGPVPALSDETIADVETIMDGGVVKARDALYQSFAGLGITGLANGSLTGLAKNAGSVFADEPMLSAA